MIRRVGAAAVLSLLVALLCGVSPVRAGADEDLAEIDQYAKEPFKQIERERAMRRLASEGGEKAAAKLVELLGDEFIHIRESATELLVNMHGDEATSAAQKDGLASKSAEVRARSAEVLGLRFASAAVEDLAKLLKKDKDETVRFRAAQALGILGGETARAALRDGLKLDGEACGECARALGRLGDAESADKLVKLLDKKDGLAAVGAADGLSALGADGYVEALAKAADHKDWRARIAVAQAFARLEKPESRETAREALEALLADDDWRVRRRTVEALVDLWDKLSIDLLAARLGEEKEAPLTYDLVHALEDLSGERKGYEPGAWQLWWKTKASSFELRQKPKRPANGWLRMPEAGAVGDGKGVSATFFDVPVFAQDAAFVFDASGSMRDELAGGKTKFDRCREELHRTLDALPEGTSFNLVIYRYESNFPPTTALLRAFDKGVRKAEKKSIDAAMKWIEGQEAKGWGAFYEGITGAMEDPAIRVVYFLSDGSPSRGRCTRRESLIFALRESTRFHPITLNTVLIGGQRRDRELMQEMAEALGGRMMNPEANDD